MRLALLLTFACATAPAIAAPAPAAPPAVEDFVSQDNYRKPVLSPDGRYLALTMDVRHLFWSYAAVVVLSLPDLKPVTALRMEMTEAPHRYQWVGPKRLLISKARQYGELDFPYPTGELVSADVDGSGQQYLYGRRRRIPGGSGYFGDLGHAVLEGLPDPLNGHLLLTEHPQGGKSTVLWNVDSSDASRTKVTEVPLPHLRFLLTDAGEPRVAIGGEGRVVKRWDAAAGWVPDERTEAEAQALALSADGNEVVERIARPGQGDVLTQRRLGEAKGRVLADLPQGDPDVIEWALDGHRPIAAASGLGRPVLRYLDDGPDVRLHQALSAQFPGQLVRFGGSTSDHGKLLFSVASDRDPGTIYLYDRATGKADLLFSLLANLDPERMPPRQPITFRARDGLELHGYLTPPVAGTVPAGRLPPLVLLPHGGPHGVADTWLFDTDAAFLATRGYAVLQVNYRGSSGRGKDFIEAGFRKWGTAIIDDLLDGVRWLVAQGQADPARVCAYGASFGAYASMMAAIRAPDVIKCAAGLSGVYDLEELREETRDAAVFMDRAVGTDAGELAANSPTRQARRLKQPVLLSHGKLDGRAEVGQVKNFIRALKDAGNPPEYWEASGEAHTYYSAENRAEFYRRLERFLGRYLKGER